MYWIEAVQNSQSIDGNYSNVTVQVWIKRTNTGYTTYGSGTVYCTIEGSTYTASLTTSDEITSTPLKIFERTMNVNHSSDGSETLNTGARISHNVFTADYHGWNMSLDTIPRASNPTASKDLLAFGDTVTIYTNRKSSNFTHTLRYYYAGTTGTIATGVGTSHAWTIPRSLMNNIPNDSYTWGTIYCDTYSGGTKVGTESVSLNTYVPSDVVPTIDSILHTEYYQSIRDYIGSNTGPYVQNQSRIRINAEGVSGVYSSTISRIETMFDGYVSGDGNHLPVENSGTKTVEVKAIDSRGKSNTISTTITVLPYSAPKVTTFSLQRVNSDGTPNDLGTYAKVTIEGTWSDLEGRSNPTITIKSKLRSTSTWTTKTTISVGTSGTYSGSTVLGTYSEIDSHDFRLEFKDQFSTTISLNLLPTGEVTMSWSNSGVGIGKVWEQGTLDVNGDMFLNNLIQGVIERGENANGKWVTYADGLTIFSYKTTVSLNIGAGQIELLTIDFPINVADLWFINVTAAAFVDGSSSTTPTDVLPVGQAFSGTWGRSHRWRFYVKNESSSSTDSVKLYCFGIGKIFMG